MICELLLGAGLYATTDPAVISARLRALPPVALAWVVTARVSGRGLLGAAPSEIVPPDNIVALKGP
jgi:hypothetical protein